jgi:hypothetical protein
MEESIENMPEAPPKAVSAAAEALDAAAQVQKDALKHIEDIDVHVEEVAAEMSNHQNDAEKLRQLEIARDVAQKRAALDVALRFQAGAGLDMQSQETHVDESRAATLTGIGDHANEVVQMAQAAERKLSLFHALVMDMDTLREIEEIVYSLPSSQHSEKIKAVNKDLVRHEVEFVTDMDHTITVTPEEIWLHGKTEMPMQLCGKMKCGVLKVDALKTEHLDAELQALKTQRVKMLRDWIPTHATPDCKDYWEFQLFLATPPEGGTDGRCPLWVKYQEAGLDSTNDEDFFRFNLHNGTGGLGFDTFMTEVVDKAGKVSSNMDFGHAKLCTVNEEEPCDTAQHGLSLEQCRAYGLKKCQMDAMMACAKAAMGKAMGITPHVDPKECWCDEANNYEGDDGVFTSIFKEALECNDDCPCKRFILEVGKGIGAYDESITTDNLSVDQVAGLMQGFGVPIGQC